MDLHQNARLTFRCREALSKKIMIEKATLNAAAAAFKVSRKTAAKWVRRYRALGLSGLQDRSSRPLRSPRRTSSQLRAQVIALRRQLRPAYQIAQATRLSPATISRILQRARLNRWCHLHPAPPVVRYEHPAPGDLLHLDIKGMTRYQQVSIRGDGRRRGRPQFAGWQALHVAIDDHSRLAFSRILPNQQCHTAIAFLRAALVFYAQHGITIRRLLTDNGSCYGLGGYAKIAGAAIIWFTHSPVCRSSTYKRRYPMHGRDAHHRDRAAHLTQGRIAPRTKPEPCIPTPIIPKRTSSLGATALVCAAATSGSSKMCLADTSAPAAVAPGLQK